MKDECARRMIEALLQCDKDALQRKYGELVAPLGALSRLGPAFMRRRVAYRIQESVYGDALTESERAALEFVASKDWLCNPKLHRPAQKRHVPTRRAVYTKVYRGTTYTMQTDALGRYVYDGRTYRSPTAIARQITKTHVNGRAWWGLK